MSPSVNEILTGPEGAYFMPLLSGRFDEQARERYRAFLAEQGDDRAELLAIEDALLRDDLPDRAEKLRRAQAILSQDGNVRYWWKLVTRTAPIRNCGSARVVRAPVRFAYQCPRTWETLDPTPDDDARHCGTCNMVVYLCRSRGEAEERARRGECITVTSASWSEISTDVSPPIGSYTGRVDPVAMWAERVFPDERGED